MFFKTLTLNNINNNKEKLCKRKKKLYLSKLKVLLQNISFKKLFKCCST